MVNRFRAPRRVTAATAVQRAAAQPAQRVAPVPQFRPHQDEDETAALAKAIEASRQTAHAERVLEGEYEMALAQSLAEKQQDERELAEAMKLSQEARRTHELDEEALAMALALSASEAEKGTGSGGPASSQSRDTFADVVDRHRQPIRPTRPCAAELEGNEGFWEDPFSGPSSHMSARRRWADEAEDLDEDEDREEELLAAAMAASLAEASDEADDAAALRAAIEASLQHSTRSTVHSSTASWRGTPATFRQRHAGATSSSREATATCGGGDEALRKAAAEADEAAALRAAIAASLRCPSGGGIVPKKSSPGEHSRGHQAAEEAVEAVALRAAIAVSLECPSGGGTAVQMAPSPGEHGSGSSHQETESSRGCSSRPGSNSHQAEEAQEAAALRSAIEESLREAPEIAVPVPRPGDSEEAEHREDTGGADRDVQAQNQAREETRADDFLVAVSAIEYGFSIFDDPLEEHVAPESPRSRQEGIAKRLPAVEPALESHGAPPEATETSNHATIHFSLSDDEGADGPEDSEGEMDSLAQWWHVEGATDALELVPAGPEQDSEWMDVGVEDVAAQR